MKRSIVLPAVVAWGTYPAAAAEPRGAQVCPYHAADITQLADGLGALDAARRMRFQRHAQDTNLFRDRARHDGQCVRPNKRWRRRRPVDQEMPNGAAICNAYKSEVARAK